MPTYRVGVTRDVMIQADSEREALELGAKRFIEELSTGDVDDTCYIDSEDSDEED